ncbi:polysaccharide deacetylase family protein [Bacillota bacterium LX-D]|nr:polysaccharide deacetylase family protein [Bacillota bacterium LX-D]
MYCFFWRKKHLGFLLIIIFVIAVASFLGYDIKQSNMVMTTMTSEPIYQGNTEYQKIALTFNVDWGTEYIPQILTILKENNAKATFFVTGRIAKKEPEIVKQIATAGQEIGNHGYLHPHPDSMNKSQNQLDIKQAEEAILLASGQTTKLYAPPYGEHKPHVVEAAEEIGYKTIMWTVDTVDWDKSRQPDTIAAKVLDGAQNGAIVLMHPTDRTVSALKKIVSELQKQGFELTTVSNILAK